MLWQDFRSLLTWRLKAADAWKKAKKRANAAEEEEEGEEEGEEAAEEREEEELGELERLSAQRQKAARYRRSNWRAARSLQSYSRAVPLLSPVCASWLAGAA
jgi:hypothetical protein